MAHHGMGAMSCATPQVWPAKTQVVTWRVSLLHLSRGHNEDVTLLVKCRVQCHVCGKPFSWQHTLVCIGKNDQSQVHADPVY